VQRHNYGVVEYSITASLPTVQVNICQRYGKLQSGTFLKHSVVIGYGMKAYRQHVSLNRISRLTGKTTRGLNYIFFIHWNSYIHIYMESSKKT